MSICCLREKLTWVFWIDDKTFWENNNLQLCFFNKTDWQILLYIMNMYIMNSNIDLSKYLSLITNMQNWFLLFEKTTTEAFSLVSQTFRLQQKFQMILFSVVAPKHWNSLSIILVYYPHWVLLKEIWNCIW